MSLKAAKAEYERFKQTWNQYPGAIDVWIRNWNHVAQLFNYGGAVRKVMYTTNAIESVNSASDEDRFVSEWGGSDEGALSADNRTIQKMVRPTRVKLGNGAESADHGW